MPQCQKSTQTKGSNRGLPSPLSGGKVSFLAQKIPETRPKPSSIWFSICVVSLWSPSVGGSNDVRPLSRILGTFRRKRGPFQPPINPFPAPCRGLPLSASSDAGNRLLRGSAGKDLADPLSGESLSPGSSQPRLRLPAVVPSMGLAPPASQTQRPIYHAGRTLWNAALIARDSAQERRREFAYSCDVK